MAYLTLISKTKNSIRIKIECVVHADDTLYYRTLLNVSGSDGSTFDTQIEYHGYVSDGNTISKTVDLAGNFKPSTTYTIKGQLQDWWGNDYGWHNGSTKETLTVTTNSETPAIQTTFTFAGKEYKYYAVTPSENHTIQINTTFYHASPGDGDYNYRLRYWYYDLTAGQTSDPTPTDTQSQLAETRGTSYYHPDTGRSHTLTYTFPAPPGHRMVTNAQLWYQANGGTWTSSGKWIGRQEFTVDNVVITPTGTWLAGQPKVIKDGKALSASGTWKQTSQGQFDWSLAIYYKKKGASNLTKLGNTETATLTKNHTMSIRRTTGELEYGEYYVDFYVNGSLDEEISFLLAEGNDGEGTWTSATLTYENGMITAKGIWKQTSSEDARWQLSISPSGALDDDFTLSQNGTHTITGYYTPTETGTYTFTFKANVLMGSYSREKSTIQRSITIQQIQTEKITCSVSNITDLTADFTVSYTPKESKNYRAIIYLYKSSLNSNIITNLTTNNTWITQGSQGELTGTKVNLSPNTLYYYKAVLQVKEGNTWVNAGIQTDPQQFTTAQADLTRFTGVISNHQCTQPVHSAANGRYQATVQFTWTPNPAYRTSNYVYQVYLDLSDHPSDFSSGGWFASDISGADTPKKVEITMTFSETNFVQPQKQWWYQITVVGSSVDGSQPKSMNPPVVETYRILTPAVEPPLPRLFKWSWDYTTNSYNQQHGTASDSLLSRAYTAVTEVDPQSTLGLKGKTTEFVFSVWNDMVYWITDMQDRLDGNASDPRRYDDSTKVMIVKSGDIIKASLWNGLRTRYNDVVDDIGGSENDYMPEVSVGDIIYGSLFTDFVDNVNKYIDAKNTAIDAENARRGW